MKLSYKKEIIKVAKLHSGSDNFNINEMSMGSDFDKYLMSIYNSDNKSMRMGNTLVSVFSKNQYVPGSAKIISKERSSALHKLISNKYMKPEFNNKSNKFYYATFTTGSKELMTVDKMDRMSKLFNKNMKLLAKRKDTPIRHRGNVDKGGSKRKVKWAPSQITKVIAMVDKYENTMYTDHNNLHRQNLIITTGVLTRELRSSIQSVWMQSVREIDPMVKVTRMSVAMELIKGYNSEKKAIAEVTKYVSKEDDLTDLPTIYIKAIRTQLKRAKKNKDKYKTDKFQSLVNQWNEATAAARSSLNTKYLYKVITNLYEFTKVDAFKFVYFTNPYVHPRPNNKGYNFYRDLAKYGEDVEKDFETYITNDVKLNKRLVKGSPAGDTEAVLSGKYLYVSKTKIMKLITPLVSNKLQKLITTDEDTHANIKKRIEINKLLTRPLANRLAGYLMMGISGVEREAETNDSNYKKLLEYIETCIIGSYKKIQNPNNNQQMLLLRNTTNGITKHAILNPRTWSISYDIPDYVRQGDLLSLDDIDIGTNLLDHEEAEIAADGIRTIEFIMKEVT